MRDLERHRKAVHEKRSLACPICPTVLRGVRNENLRRHIKTCHGPNSLAALASYPYGQT
ncbi:uncharacterized protein CTRU02_214512 [Colletotrichum truncatum]|uniref:Uncharacterized protein n=1 Tax=Colletotrichum truncatum TaxID=5467 RepID=A0ACC3YGD2_COLTU|nr:uncharacterized protein CTRU02_12182 [Colletotrichum truncatum]KAF6784971.1 hypothetical protein CTRU02_12182 [Colletotrichum truncatum]